MADKLTDDDIVKIVTYGIGQSVGWSESKLSVERETVAEYYEGERPKQAHHGDSTYVSMDVYDAVESMSAQLLEVFSGNNTPLKFIAGPNEPTQAAQVRTDYANDVVYNQNPGFEVFHQTIKQGLLGRNAICKVFWEEVGNTEYFHLNDATLAELTAHMEAHPKAEIKTLELHEGGESVKKVTLAIPMPKRQVRILPLMGEEFGISPMAKSIKDAELVYHRTEMTHSELIKAGYDKDVVDSLQDNEKLWQSMNSERIQRFQSTDDFVGTRGDEDGQDASKVCLVYEAYANLDMEGDGTAQLYKVTLVGNTILDKEPVDRKPFIDFCPLPRPGAFYGHNYAKFVIPTQKARTYLTRSIINHALVTNNPRMQVVKGGVMNPRELLENRFGGIVNVTRPDAIIPLQQAGLNPFVFQTIQLLDKDKEEITGISSLSQGLNKDALSKQNSEGMVRELITVSQTRQKIVARSFAEFMRRLYTEVYHLVVENEDRQKVIRVAGGWVPVDFTSWPEDCTLEVSFALGYGEQEQEAQKWGMVGKALASDPALAGNYTPEQHYVVARRGLEALGIKDVDSVLLPPDKAKPPPPDPLHQAEIAMKQADAQVKQANAQAALKNIELEQQKIQLQHQLEMAKLQAEIQKVTGELQLKQDMLAHKVAVDAAEIALEQQIAASAQKTSATAVAAPTRN